jgi:hypothetical protein
MVIIQLDKLNTLLLHLLQKILFGYIDYYKIFDIHKFFQKTIIVKTKVLFQCSHNLMNHKGH